MPYCSNCNKWHEITTGGCSETFISYPYNSTSSYVYTSPLTIESRLDKIIELLEQILTKGGK